MSDKVLNFLYLLVSLTLLCLACVSYSLNESSSRVSEVALLITINYIFKFRKSVFLVILFGFAMLYNIDAYKYFHSNILLTAWPDFQEKYIVNKVLLLHATFIIALGTLIPYEFSLMKIQFNTRLRPNKVLFLFN